MMIETSSETAARPLQAGDRVRAGWKMLGCDMAWWQGDGVITEIAVPATNGDEPVHPLALVNYDDPVPCPCSHHQHEPSNGCYVSLNVDLTAARWSTHTIERI